MNKTVLIIDDDDILRKALAHGLRNASFYVLTASSAENATDVLSRISVDALVLDRMMTGIDGLTFLQNLRQSGNTTPTIMLTALTGPENAIAGLMGGANDYLAKPFQIQELILRLKNIIRPDATVSDKMPSGLIYNDDEFFISNGKSAPKLISLSGEEKKLLKLLTTPTGNIAPASPMVAKRLRNKLNLVLSDLDIITIRGQGYKLIDRSATTQNNGDR